MYRYAQIDNNGYVVSDSFLSGEVHSENMIPIEEDFDLSNKKYNTETKQWETYEPQPQPQPEPTQLDRIEEVVISTALTTEYMACLQEVNAE